MESSLAPHRSCTGGSPVWKLRPPTFPSSPLFSLAPHRSCTGGSPVWKLPQLFPLPPSSLSLPTGPAPVGARFGNYAAPPSFRSSPWPNSDAAPVAGGMRWREAGAWLPNLASTGAGPVGAGNAWLPNLASTGAGPVGAGNALPNLASTGAGPVGAGNAWLPTLASTGAGPVGAGNAWLPNLASTGADRWGGRMRSGKGTKTGASQLALSCVNGIRHSRPLPPDSTTDCMAR